jgi:hypothetical protein
MFLSCISGFMYNSLYRTEIHNQDHRKFLDTFMGPNAIASAMMGVTRNYFYTLACRVTLDLLLPITRPGTIRTFQTLTFTVLKNQTFAEGFLHTRFFRQVFETGISFVTWAVFWIVTKYKNKYLDPPPTTAAPSTTTTTAAETTTEIVTNSPDYNITLVSPTYTYEVSSALDYIDVTKPPSIVISDNYKSEPYSITTTEGYQKGSFSFKRSTPKYFDKYKSIIRRTTTTTNYMDELEAPQSTTEKYIPSLADPLTSTIGYKSYPMRATLNYIELLRGKRKTTTINPIDELQAPQTTSARPVGEYGNSNEKSDFKKVSLKYVEIFRDKSETTKSPESKNPLSTTPKFTDVHIKTVTDSAKDKFRRKYKPKLTTSKPEISTIKGVQEYNEYLDDPLNIRQFEGGINQAIHWQPSIIVSQLQFDPFTSNESTSDGVNNIAIKNEQSQMVSSNVLQMENTSSQTVQEKTEEIALTISKSIITSSASNNISNSSNKSMSNEGQGNKVMDHVTVGSQKKNLESMSQGLRNYEAKPAIMNEIPKQMHQLKYKTYANVEPYFKPSVNKT